MLLICWLVKTLILSQLINKDLLKGVKGKKVPKSIVELSDLINQLIEQCKAAATQLQFELAARLRDEISDLEKGVTSNEKCFIVAFCFVM